MLNKYTYTTNKLLIRVTRKKAFRDLHIEVRPEFANGPTLEQFSSLESFYLMDEFIEEGYYEEIFLEKLKEISKDIFICELSSTTIPIEKWPDVEDFDTFLNFFDIKQKCLEADLGKLVCTNRKIV